MNKAQKRLMSSALAAASVFTAVAPVVHAETVDVETLVQNALNGNNFYEFNIALGEVMKLEKVDAAKYNELLNKLGVIAEKVYTEEIKDLNALVDKIAYELSGRAYDEFEAKVTASTTLGAMDKGYYLGELAKWGRSHVWTADYTAAVNTVGALWTKIDDASVKAAEDAVAKLSGDNKAYLTELLNEVKEKKEYSAFKVASATALNSQKKEVSLDAMPVNGKVKLTFSKKVNEDTVNVNTLRVYEVDGNVPVAVNPQSIVVAEDGLSVTVAATLDNETEYKLVVNGVAQDEAEAKISNYVVNFTTSDVIVVTDVDADAIIESTDDVEGGEIVFTLDKEVVPSTSTTAVVLTNTTTGKRVAAKVVYDENTITVTADFVVDNGYKVVLKGLEGFDGAPVEQYEYKFNVGAVAPVASDYEITIVGSGDDLADNTNVWPKATSGLNTVNKYFAGLKINIALDRKLDEATIAENVVLIETESEAVVPTTFDYNADALILSIAPKSDLKEGTDYTLSFKKNLASDLGAKLGEDGEYEVSFTTQDLTAPTVVSLVSKNGDTGLKIAEKQEFTVKFSEAVTLEENTNVLLVEAGTSLTKIAEVETFADVTVAPVADKVGEYKITIAANTFTNEHVNKAFKLVIVGRDKSKEIAVADESENENQLKNTYIYTFTTEGADVAGPVVKTVFKGDSIADADAKTTLANVAGGQKLTVLFDEEVVVDNAEAKLQYYKNGKWQGSAAVTVAESGKSTKAVLLTLPADLAAEYKDAKVRVVLEKVEDNLENKMKAAYNFEMIATAGNDTVKSVEAKTYNTDGTEKTSVEVPAQDIATDAKLVVTFNEAKLAEVTASNITVVDAAGNAVAGTFKVDAENAAVYVFTPDAKLTASTVYTVTIDGVKDTVGNAVTKKITSFKTAGANAVVSSTGVVDGQTNVDLNKSFTVVFDKDVRKTGDVDNKVTVAIKDGDATVATATTTDGKTYTFKAMGLTSLKSYQLVVEVLKADDTAIISKKTYNFITGTTSTDDVKPTLSTVEGKAVVDKIVDLDKTSSLAVKFSETIKIDAATVTVEDLSNDKVVGVLPLTVATDTLTIKTAGELDGTVNTYKVTIKGIKDAAGNVADDVVVYIQ